MIYTCRWCDATYDDNTPTLFLDGHAKAHGFPDRVSALLFTEKEEPMYQIRPAYFRPRPTIRHRLIVAWFLGSIFGALIIYAAVMLWSRS